MVGPEKRLIGRKAICIFSAALAVALLFSIVFAEDPFISDRATRWFQKEFRALMERDHTDTTPPVITNPRIFPYQLKRGDPRAEISANVHDGSGISSVYAEVGRKQVLMFDLDGDGRYIGYCGSNLPPGDYDVNIVAVDRAGNAAVTPCRALKVLDPLDLNANRIEDSLESLGPEETRVIVLHDDNVTESDGEKLRSIDILRGSAMLVPGNKIPELARLRGVKGIYRDQKLRVLGAQCENSHAGSDMPGPPENPRRAATGLTGKGVTVALIDTGVDAGHETLDDIDDDPATSDPKVVAFVDMVNKLEKPYDDNGHGTHCASLISGTKGMGVAPGSRLVVLKVMDRDGSCYLSDALSALDWCAKNKDIYDIRVISFSVGGDRSSDRPTLLDEACNRMAEEGIVVVVAAGNSGPSPSSIVVPGEAEEVITVGAIDARGKIFERSSRGPTSDGRIKPDIVTIGVDVPSALAGTRDDESCMSGTSMAVPQVAGAAAIILEGFGNLTPADVKRVLLRSADDLGDPGADNTFGWGAMNITRAVLYLRNDPEMVAGPELKSVDLSSNEANVGDLVVIEALVAGEVEEVTSTITGAEKEVEIPMVDFDLNSIYTTFWETGLWKPGDYTIKVELRGRYGERVCRSRPFRLNPRTR
ncbi:MAG: S8 family peptidase [Methanothrix sp.]|uniref:S8 family peptidase n=1 Tax=Methanothrix sp. TaxID=90426 RepID=UPI0025CEADD6|nr:S8 family peptidase [Methanothrix sp.]MCQ8903091.1 S8 family peptidase [Methanothrix sp.]